MRCAALLILLALLASPPRAGGASRWLANSGSRRAAAARQQARSDDTAAAAAKQSRDELPRLDLVLSHYNEPLLAVTAFVARARAALPSSVAAAGVRVFFLTHGACAADGAPIFPPANATTEEDSQRVPPSWQVTCLPNYGKESYAYLRWIEAHRHDFSRLVWFSQAQPDDYMEPRIWPRLPLLTRRTGMLGLALVLDASCDGGSEVALGTYLGALHYVATRRFCTFPWTVFWNGEFVVSARRLRAQPARLYTSLRETLELPDGHGVHNADARWREPKSGALSTRANPKFGYAMERAWNVLWNCTRMHLPGACGCDATHPDGCVAHACQCLDDE
jgi:hypothetical protein